MFESKKNWQNHLTILTEDRNVVCLFAIMPVIVENNP